MHVVREWFEATSDCKGDGYDIAEAPHIDDKPRVEVHPDRLIWREPIRLGKRNQPGPLVGYRVRSMDLDPRVRHLLQTGRLRVVMQQVSEALGAWEHARRRGRFRACLIDPALPHRRINQRGLLAVLWDSGSLCLDYPGGQWGYGKAQAQCERIVQAFQAALRPPMRLAA